MIVKLIFFLGIMNGITSQSTKNISDEIFIDSNEYENYDYYDYSGGGSDSDCDEYDYGGDCNKRKDECDDVDQVTMANDLISKFVYFNKDIVPVRNQKRFKVPLKFKRPRLNNIAQFDELQGSIISVFHVDVIWTDEIRRWDTSETKCIHTLEISQDKIWTPPFAVLNYINDDDNFGKENNLARIEKDGTVQLEYGGKFQTDCAPDMKKFPFDRQVCSILVYPRGFRVFELPVEQQTIDVKVRNKRNGQWEVINANMILMGDNAYIEIVMTIERKSLYFVLEVILPLISLCFLNPVVFLLPGDNGDRMNLTIVITLSFAVYLSMIASVMPKTSEPLPLIIYYIFTAQVMSIVIVVLNIITTVIYSRTDDKTIPAVFLHIHRFFNRVRQKCCCCKKDNANKLKRNRAANRFSNRVRSNCCQNAKANELQQDGEENCNETFKLAIHVDDVVVTNEHDVHSLTWETIGKTFDKIFFVLGYGLFAVGAFQYTRRSGWLD